MTRRSVPGWEPWLVCHFLHILLTEANPQARPAQKKGEMLPSLTGDLQSHIHKGVRHSLGSYMETLTLIPKVMVNKNGTLRRRLSQRGWRARGGLLPLMKGDRRNLLLSAISAT